MNHPIRLFAATLACVFAAGCATLPETPAARQQLAGLFQDTGLQTPRPVTSADVFALSEPMQAFMQSEYFQREIAAKGGERGLADALYAKQALRLEYDDLITRDAATTFADRKGNCLSLVIMTAAFAKALKLEINYHDVRIGTEWSRDRGLYVGSNHVNIGLGTPRRATATPMDAVITPGHVTIDFIPTSQADRQRVRRLTEKTIVAMYLNNRAVEEMSAGRVENAYWWARAAIEKDPNLVTSYNTLGVIYQKRGLDPMAEKVFSHALALAPENTMLMDNLAPVLAAGGKTDEARALSARSAALMPAPPFHYFKLGMAAMTRADYVEAKNQFGHEVRRAPYNHEFRYWLAMAHLRLGETDAARKEMAVAVENSGTGPDAKRYSSKLALLRAMGAGRTSY